MAARIGRMIRGIEGIEIFTTKTFRKNRGVVHRAAAGRQDSRNRET
jgi:hypothetical protein